MAWERSSAVQAGPYGILKKALMWATLPSVLPSTTWCQLYEKRRGKGCTNYSLQIVSRWYLIHFIRVWQRVFQFIGFSQAVWQYFQLSIPGGSQDHPSFHLLWEGFVLLLSSWHWAWTLSYSCTLLWFYHFSLLLVNTRVNMHEIITYFIWTQDLGNKTSYHHFARSYTNI